MAVRQNSLPALPVQDGVEFKYLPFDERYCVSDDGRVFSCTLLGSKGGGIGSVWRQLAAHKGKRGYFAVRIGGKNPYVHSLVLTAFVRAREPKEECRHLNGIPTDNRLENLAWGTSRQNKRDKIGHSTHLAGERHPNTKFTNEQVAAIRKLVKRHKSGSGMVMFLARWFGIGYSSISFIASGRYFKSGAPDQSAS